MMINELFDKSDRTSTPFEGIFRVAWPRWRKTQKGADFIVANLVDVSGGITAYGWEGKYDGPHDLTDLERVRIVATCRTFNGALICDIRSMERSGAGKPFDLIPNRLITNRELIPRLVEIINSLQTPALRQFVGDVMNDDRLFLPFLQVPASARHHHCEATGLLRHSIECAATVSALPDLHGPMRELAIVTALLHDIGKVKCFEVSGKRTISGYVLDHNSITLELLAPHLAGLDAAWSDGGVALRYLLTWQTGRRMSSVPLLTVAESVAYADRVSSGFDREQQAFSAAPDWERFARLSATNRYWRPRLNMDC